MKDPLMNTLKFIKKNNSNAMSALMNGLVVLKIFSRQKRNWLTTSMLTTQVKKICAICQKEFNTNYNLKRHMQTHEGSQKDIIFLCTVCQKTFSTFYNLNVHTNAYNM